MFFSGKRIVSFIKSYNDEDEDKSSSDEVFFRVKKNETEEWFLWWLLVFKNIKVLEEKVNKKRKKNIKNH